MPDAPSATEPRGHLDRIPLSVLEQHDAFAGRHIGPSESEQKQMLDALGYPTRGALIDAVVPPAIRRTSPMNLPPPRSEAEALAELRALASKNVVYKSFIGQGYYGTHPPGVILRNVLENPAWYTAFFDASARNSASASASLRGGGRFMGDVRRIAGGTSASISAAHVG